MGLSRLYRMWGNMKHRCTATNRSDSKYYSLKGIKVCPDWQRFNGFEKWALANGYEIGMSIERRENDKDYMPSNCHFIPLSEQQKNRSNVILLTYNGRTMTLTDWSRELKVPWKTLKSRLDLGYSVEAAFEKRKGVLRLSKLFEYEGDQYTKAQLARKFNVNKQFISRKLKAGLTISQIKSAAEKVK